jgi:hypothetical protein
LAQIDESQGLLSGEKVFRTAGGEVVVRQEGGGDLPRKGTLHFTNYRLFLSQEVCCVHLLPHGEQVPCGVY